MIRTLLNGAMNCLDPFGERLNPVMKDNGGSLSEDDDVAKTILPKQNYIK